MYCKNKKECSRVIKIVVDTKSIANRKEKIILKYPIRKYVEVLGYNGGMKKYGKNLRSFISDIENKNIKQNEIVVSNVKENIVDFVKKKGFDFENTDIKLTVRRYKHLLRDYKKRRIKNKPKK